MLGVKLLRDVWRLRAQSAAIALIIAAGIGMVIMSMGMIRSLDETRMAYYDRYRFADLFAPVSRAPEGIISEVQAIPGIAVAESRLSTAAALDIAGDCGHAIWVEDRNVAEAEVLESIISARQLDAGSLLEHARSAEVAARYVQHSQEAIARNVFGAPTYAFHDELFWGQDRLEFLDRALAR